MKSEQLFRNKETALKSMLDKEREGERIKPQVDSQPSYPQQQMLPFDQGVEQGPPKAAEPEIEAPKLDQEALIL